jgi:hypothetical protein
MQLSVRLSPDLRARPVKMSVVIASALSRRRAKVFVGLKLVPMGKKLTHLKLVGKEPPRLLFKIVGQPRAPRIVQDLFFRHFGSNDDVLLLCDSP